MLCYGNCSPSRFNALRRPAQKTQSVWEIFQRWNVGTRERAQQTPYSRSSRLVNAMGRSGFVPQPDNLGLIVLGFILQPNLPLESTLNHLIQGLPG